MTSIPGAGLVRTGAARVVDAALPRLGGLPAYLSAVRAITPGRSPVARRARVSLSLLPSAQHSDLVVQAEPVEFRYLSVPGDDLQFACRLGLVGWEPTARWLFRLLAAESRSVVDVGAYSGIYSITAALANPDCRVLAIEPNPAMAALARANVAANALDDRVDVLQVALATADGTAELVLPTGAPESSLASLVATGDGERIPVQTRRLDDVAGEEGVDLIKIDVESGEPGVLAGGADVLAANEPVILMEALTPEELAGQRTLLAAHGYADPVVVNSATRSDARMFAWATARRSPLLLAGLEEARRQVASRRRR
ncbi:MAG: FkbM family methyltransferase [Actinomycetota bacterium]|nr:FkbM family methyltransferase [Actinomycetota bacterium]